MFELRQLAHFVAVVDFGTVSKAAENLNITQPALSRSLRNLEYELGAPLFLRTKNKVSLSKTGEMAVSLARKLLSDADCMSEMVREFHRSHTKIVIESCAPCELLFGLRDAVADVFGGVECETAVVDEESIEGDLLCGKCSIGLFSERKENPLLVQVALRTERLFAMIPTGHALAKKDCVTFSEINGEPVIPFPLKGHWNDLLERMLPDSQLLYQSSVESFDKVVHASSLISFESNFLEIDVADHVRVPVVDGEARITYHAAVLGRMASSGCFPEFLRSLDSLKD